MDFLAETALLTHGLRSISNEELRSAWTVSRPCLAWVERGTLRVGTMEEYLPFRSRGEKVGRIDCEHLEDALKSGASGALTASGTMAACHRLGVFLAVSCGIGGIGDIRGEELCPDLPALVRYPVALLATAPKDMLDVPATFGWLWQHGVHVAGSECTGYLFHSTCVALDEGLAGYGTAEAVRRAAERGLLLLRPIPEEERIADLSILHATISAGKQAEALGSYYHPAANGEIDRRTGGESSRMQLRSFLANVQAALELN